MEELYKNFKEDTSFEDKLNLWETFGFLEGVETKDKREQIALLYDKAAKYCLDNDFSCYFEVVVFPLIRLLCIQDKDNIIPIEDYDIGFIHSVYMDFKPVISVVEEYRNKYNVDALAHLTHCLKDIIYNILIKKKKDEKE